MAVSDEYLKESGYVERHHRKVKYYTDGDMVVAKMCSKCGEIKMVSDFGKHEGCLGGVRSNCKECVRDARKKYVEENTEKIREYRRKYHARNRDELNTKTKQWYLSNREKHRASGKDWESRNLDKVRDYKRAWYEENRDRISRISKERYDANPEKKRKYSLSYSKNNPDKAKVARQRREARKMELPDTLTAEELREILDHFGNACCLTGSKEDVQLDHVIPIAIGHGGTTRENIVPLNSRLNNSKHAAHVFEWFDENRERLGLRQNEFDSLIEYLARINEMTPQEYRKYVDWCFDNPRNTDDNQR